MRHGSDDVALADRACSSTRSKPRSTEKEYRLAIVSKSKRVLTTYMHSAWNSCPQGKLITRLCPSTYSSKQTTHSTWRPVYFRRHKLDESAFSLRVDACFALCELDTAPGGGDRARERTLPEALRWPKSGEVEVRGPGLVARGVLVAEEDEVLMVWYVLTGRRSTRDLGARHRLRRIRDRSNRSA